jgi:LysM repeat protein
MSPSALFAAHKPAVIIGGVGGAAGLALVLKRKKGAASTASSVGTTNPSDPYQSIGSDVYNSLAPQLDNLQQQIQALQNTNAPTVAPNPPPVVAPPITPAPAPGPAPPALPPPAAAAPTTYTVRSGDTLWDIAGRLMGNHNAWRAIANANGITPYQRNGIWYALIRPGQKLIIPK